MRQFWQKHQTKFVINGRWLTMRDSGVTRVGTELLYALMDEIAESGHKIDLRLAAPASAKFERPDGSWILSRGFEGKLGEQLLPAAYPEATILNFCNVTPLLARRSILWIHDTHTFDTPATYPRLYRWWHRSIFNTARLRNFEIVTVSAYARERLIHHGIDARRVRVVYNGGDHILRAPPDSSILATAGVAEGPFVLVVGSPARHKNVPFALRALLAHTNASLKIAVVGLSQVARYAEAEPPPQHERIVLLPPVTDAQLRALYEAAQAVIAPSLVEGFGLFAAEAMFADSGPLVLSNRTALPEVGGEAALYFEPTDPRQLAAAVEESFRPEVVTRLRERARIQREKFRWRTAARQVIDEFLS